MNQLNPPKHSALAQQGAATTTTTTTTTGGHMSMLVSGMSVMAGGCLVAGGEIFNMIFKNANRA